jgi:hypothetical protein
MELNINIMRILVQEAESVIDASRRAKQEAEGVQRRIQDAARRPVSMFESSGGVYYSPDSTVRRQSKDVGTVRSVCHGRCS